jgi:hypothetical protein
LKARIIVVSDTARQAEAMASRIALSCAEHRRVPYERVAALEFGPPM